MGWLIGLLLAGMCMFGVIIYVAQQGEERRAACELKGGVYLDRQRVCAKIEVIK